MIWKYNITQEKANVVADALSRKGQVNNITTHLMAHKLCWEMEHLNLRMLNNMEATVMEVESTLEEEIRKEHEHLRQLILREAHDSAYSIHPRSTKMYQDLKEKYW